MANKRNYRKYRLAKKYSLTEAQYEALAETQGGRCAICREFPVPRHGVVWLYVDHDHETGKVRGLLCNLCNLAIGKFRERPDVLRAAAAYVELHRLGLHVVQLTGDVKSSDCA